jgi:hypothetical protein
MESADPAIAPSGDLSGHRVISRLARRLVVLWVVLGVVLWNGVFDLIQSRGMREYLFRQAAYDAGRGRPVTIREIMDQANAEAVLIASIWTLVVAGAGIGTVWLLSRDGGRRQATGPGR